MKPCRHFSTVVYNTAICEPCGAVVHEDPKDPRGKTIVALTQARDEARAVYEELCRHVRRHELHDGESPVETMERIEADFARNAETIRVLNAGLLEVLALCEVGGSTGEIATKLREVLRAGNRASLEGT